MIIDVLKICKDDYISRNAGAKIREIILGNWGEDIIEIKLRHTMIGSVSFFDEAIGLLIKRDNKSLDEIKKKLKFPDILPEDRNLLNYTVLARAQECKIKKG